MDDDDAGCFHPGRAAAAPHGDAALAVADSMNRSNSALNLAAIGLLAVAPANASWRSAPAMRPSRPSCCKRRAASTWALNCPPPWSRPATGGWPVPAWRPAAMRLGDAHALPVDEASVDAALAVNTLYFWPNLAPVLDELARVLRREAAVPGVRRCGLHAQPAVCRRFPAARTGRS